MVVGSVQPYILRMVTIITTIIKTTIITTIITITKQQ